MKITTLILILSLCLVPLVIADDYTTDYCQDPVELQKWDTLLMENPDSEELAAIHALWIGLCLKVEARQLTTLKANKLFKRFRDALIEQIKQQQAADQGEKS